MGKRSARKVQKFDKKSTKNDKKMTKNDKKMTKNDQKMTKKWPKNDQKWVKNSSISVRKRAKMPQISLHNSKKRVIKKGSNSEIENHDSTIEKSRLNSLELRVRVRAREFRSAGRGVSHLVCAAAGAHPCPWQWTGWEVHFEGRFWTDGHLLRVCTPVSFVSSY